MILDSWSPTPSLQLSPIFPTTRKHGLSRQGLQTTHSLRSADGSMPFLPPGTAGNGLRQEAPQTVNAHCYLALVQTLTLGSSAMRSTTFLTTIRGCPLESVKVQTGLYARENKNFQLPGFHSITAGASRGNGRWRDTRPGRRRWCRSAGA